MHVRVPHVLALMALFVLAAAVARPAQAEITSLSPRAAYEMASKGEILLVDIRTPGEWRRSGVGTSAVTISMHRSGFLDKLNAAVGGDRSKPIALICAAGERSAYMSRILDAQGYRNIIDVPEGMMGSAAGPGWISRGLPVRTVDGE